MEKRFLEYVKEHKMTRPGGRVLIALSGGGDSVCLLYLFSKCREELDIELAAVHVHHGIRGAEADRDAEFSGRLCERLKIPFVLRKEDVPAYAKARGISLEEAGRETRYRILEEERIRLDADCIAAAHHMDDSAETIFYNLIRGSGLKGLAGIAPVRGRIIRPLLGFRRSEILHYLGERGIEYCSDSTNEELDYARNRIRSRILPEAERLNGRAVEHVVRTGDFLGQADCYFKKLAVGVLEESEDGIAAGRLLSLEPPADAYVIMELVRRAGGSLKDFGAKHMELVRGLAEKSTGASVDLPGGIRACCQYGRILVRAQETPAFVPQEEKNVEIRVFPREKGGEIPKNQYTKWFDYDKIKGTLSVRHREQGDYFTLPDGGRKTVKSYMIDQKIPRELRDRILVAADGKHVLWIVGYRISEYYKVSDNTENILQIRLDKGDTHGR